MSQPANREPKILYGAFFSLMFSSTAEPAQVRTKQPHSIRRASELVE